MIPLTDFFGETAQIGFTPPAVSSDRLGMSPKMRKGYSGTLERQSDASIVSPPELRPCMLADRAPTGDRLR